MSDNDIPAFSVETIPFSYHGSWLSISPVLAQHEIASDLHLISHRVGRHPILRLTPEMGGVRVETRWEATASVLTWTHDDGRTQIAYESEDVLRIRGAGLSMRLVAAAPVLTPFTGFYLFTDPSDGAAVLTHYESGRRYRITTITGTVAVFGDESLGRAQRGVLVAPGGNGTWELAVESLATSRRPYVAAHNFEGVTSRATEVFVRFLADIAPWRSVRTPAAVLAVYVVWSATVAPEGFLRRPGVLMSKHWMDKVWSWDHCFNALALAQGRPDLAIDQFLTPFDHQTPEGALPDSVAHSEILYNFVKPPIHGWALAWLRRRLPGQLSRETLEDIYSKLAAWTRFWLTDRRTPGQPLPHYQHGNDSGWDNATTFDTARVIETADLAAFLSGQLTVLSDLADELGHREDRAAWATLATEVSQAMHDLLWDGDGYVSRDARTGASTRSASLLDLLPITLGSALPSDVAEHLADGIRSHLTAWGPATEPPSSPRYQADGYWRGPIWAPATMLVEDGLRRAGFVDLADEISQRFRHLCERSGFAENFDAVTGAGLRDRAYTWTASVYLLLAADAEARAATTRTPMGTAVAR